jgi:hypothetical protein
VAGAFNALHRGMRRNTYLHASARSAESKNRQEVLHGRPDVSRVGTLAAAVGLIQPIEHVSQLSRLQRAESYRHADTLRSATTGRLNRNNKPAQPQQQAGSTATTSRLNRKNKPTQPVEQAGSTGESGRKRR